MGSPRKVISNKIDFNGMVTNVKNVDDMIALVSYFYDDIRYKYGAKIARSYVEFVIEVGLEFFVSVWENDTPFTKRYQKRLDKEARNG